jgi:hypothetical protein
VTDASLDSVIVGDLEYWLGQLPDYQRALTRSLIDETGSEEAAAAAWLSASGPTDVFPYGAAANSRDTGFLGRVKHELRLLICGGDQYDEERAKLRQQLSTGSKYVVGFAAGAVAHNLGTAPTVIGPPVALLFAVAAKVGVRAWCLELEPVQDTPPDPS